MASVVPKEREVLGELQQLMQLQTIDYDLGELERSKEYLPDMMENLNREIDEIQTRLDDAVKTQEESNLKQSSLELEVATKQKELEKYQKQMMSIKTNKEYDALVSQIDTLKQEIDAAETEILNTIEQLSGLEKEIAESKEQLSGIEENNHKQLDILKVKINSIGDKVADKDKERSAVITSIPRQVLSIYERVRRGRGGDVVVAVKRRACGACFKSLTPKNVQEIKGGGKIFTCDYCGRILYWHESESP